MPRALVDTSVLFAAANRRDRRHDDGLPILRGIDRGDLPEGVVLDFVLAETLTGLASAAGHEEAVDFLDRLERNDRFEVRRLTADGLATAKSVFRRYARLSFVDASLVAYARTQQVEYCYSFDDDFDGFDGLVRLRSAVDPFAP